MPATRNALKLRVASLPLTLRESRSKLTRYALAMVTSVHASPEDLPSLTEDLAANRSLQGMVAYACCRSSSSKAPANSQMRAEQH